MKTKEELNDLKEKTETVSRKLLELTDEELALVSGGLETRKDGCTGEMEQMSAIMRPDIGIVTNIGAAHLEGLGTLENVLAEKLKIFAHSPSGFTAFLNGDDPLLRTVTDIRGVKPRFFHASALELLSTCPGRRIAVLGDMFELGENAPEYHRQIGAFAAGKKIDTLVCIGALAENIALGALEVGCPKTSCAVYPTVDAFLAEVCFPHIKFENFPQLTQKSDGIPSDGHRSLFARDFFYSPFYSAPGSAH